MITELAAIPWTTVVILIMIIIIAQSQLISLLCQVCQFAWEQNASYSKPVLLEDTT